MIFVGVADRGDDIVQAARADDAYRTQLIDAGVACVELSENVVAADVAFQQAAKIFLDSLLFSVHEPKCEVGNAERGLDSINPQSEIRNPKLKRTNCFD